MEVPRLGAELELQLLAYITARATRDLSLVCDLHHGSRQRRILNPLSGPGIEPASTWILLRFISAEPRLQPTPQLTATPDPQPTERGQGANPQPHGSWLDSLTTAPRQELQKNFFFIKPFSSDAYGYEAGMFV